VKAPLLGQNVLPRSTSGNGKREATCKKNIGASRRRIERMATSEYLPSGSLIKVTHEEAAATLEVFGKWIVKNIQIGTFGVKGRPLPLLLQIQLRKGDGPADVSIYEHNHQTPIGFPRKDTEELAKQMIACISLNEPSPLVGQSFGRRVKNY
jgi:hypothetical protein